MKYIGGSHDYIMALMALAAISDQNQFEKGNRFIPDSEDDKIRMQERQQQLLKKKGVKQFTIDGETVYARDYINAERKVKNIKNKS